MNNIISRILLTEVGRRLELQTLMQLVTSSLGLPSQNLLFRPSAQSLDAFAAFTTHHLADSSTEQQQRLHARALRLGRLLRRCLTHRGDEALTSLTFLLYRNIGIQMEGHFPGQVTISRCHFCRHYSPQICSLASLMDDGVICGLFGQGHLLFHQRLTEGHNSCQCELVPPNPLSLRH